MSLTKLKVILLGVSGVGKTSIINQYIKKNFVETLSTIGSEQHYKIIKINKKEIQLKIWDTPGKTKFFNITKNSMRNTDIAILIYDITNKESFISLKQWYKKLIEVIKKDNIIIGIASNKSDLLNEEVITSEEINTFAEEINVDVFSTSAKNYDNIEEMFFKLTEKYYNKFLNNKNKSDLNNSYIIIEKNNDKSFYKCNC